MSIALPSFQGCYKPAGGSGDPNFSSVVLLSHFDGVDGSTTLVDEKGHTLTANGNAQLDTAQSKFGTASLLLDGTGDYVTSPDSADWTPTGDFTIEGWVRFAAITSSHVFCSQYNSVGNQRGWYFRRTSSARLTFNFHPFGDGTVENCEGGWTTAINTWYHVAATRSGNVYRVFADGVQIASRTTSFGPFNSNSVLAFGAVDSSSFSQFFNGWLDDWRITNGVARYTGAFTPPTAAFPNS